MTASLSNFHRLAITFRFYLLVAGVSLITRLALLVKSFSEIEMDFALAGAFLLGLFFDLCFAVIVSAPFVLYLLFVPQRLFAAKWHQWLMRGLTFVLLYVLFFGVVAEWFFWDEFQVRFNFIAVDYLVYTTEVVRNIHESYPMPLILSALAIVAGAGTWLVMRRPFYKSWLASETRFRARWKPALGMLLVPLLVGLLVDQSLIPNFDNNFKKELAKNGTFSLFSAFWKNELDYEEWYLSKDQEACFKLLREDLTAPGVKWVSDDPSDLRRDIDNAGEEKPWNLVLICVESLSGEYLAPWNKNLELTPNLNRLTQEGLFFRHLYATGTRTVRGMEALTLSMPPTPGRSIIKREKHENLFCLSTPFVERGYDSVFLYGGRGYFDNMNHFFGGNGYRIVDEATASGDDVTFSNAWGACDGDLYNWTLSEADRAYAEGKPFNHFLMTTSNHRPYSYPEGKVSIPPGSREGAVQYTDYAIGKFLEDAKSHPWFDKTVFAIVGDHCASSAGKLELPIRKYEIPLIFYAPGLIEPRQVETLCSQIDFAPTLFGLLGWDYRSQFFGRDILKMEKEEGRAFIGNYQKVGIFTDGAFDILLPMKETVTYACKVKSSKQTPAEPAPGSIERLIAYYQTASYLYQHDLLKKH